MEWDVILSFDLGNKNIDVKSCVELYCLHFVILIASILQIYETMHSTILNHLFGAAEVPLQYHQYPFSFIHQSFLSSFFSPCYSEFIHITSSKWASEVNYINSELRVKWNFLFPMKTNIFFHDGWKILGNISHWQKYLLWAKEL